MGPDSGNPFKPGAASSSIVVHLSRLLMEVDEKPQEAQKAQPEALSSTNSGRNGPRRGQLTPAETDAFLAQRFAPEISTHLQSFCAIKLTESELSFLNSHPEIINEDAVDALKQIATRANNRSDEVNAFRYNRKAEIIAVCLELGSVAAFAKTLDDPEACVNFFDRVGPPPGYDDDYYDMLAHLYWEGDNLNESAAKQALGALSPAEQQLVLDKKLAQEGHLVAPRRQKPSELLGTPQTLAASMVEKYVPAFLDLTLEPASTSLGLEVVDDETLALLDHQLQDRRHVISEFVHQHGGMKRFLNWMTTMLPANRVELVSACAAEFILSEHPLKDITSDRQAHLLLPELSDPFLLVKDECLLLFEIAVRTAMARENQFPKITPTASSSSSDQDTEASNSAEKEFFKDSMTVSPVVVELHRQYRALRAQSTTTVESILSWVQQQQDKFEMYVPALIYLEWTLEDAIIDLCPHLFSPSQLQFIKERRFASFSEFEEPVLMFRTRVIQLFVLSLVEKCLIETLPRPRPGRKRKRK